MIHIKIISYLWFSGESGEPEVNQGTCQSKDKNLDLSPPVKSGNHMAKCGFVNIFSYAKSECTIQVPSLQQC